MPDRAILLKKFFSEIRSAMERKGNILIPVFAFHRSQEMAKRIDQAMKLKAIPQYNVYYISTLGYKITKYYNRYKDLLKEEVQLDEEPFNYKHVKRIHRIGQIKEPAIVICTSGFGHAGSSLRLLTEWAPDERNTVIINTGYIPPDSPLNLAKKKGEFMKDDDKIDVKASVEHIELSGHADQKQLIEFVKTLKPKQTFLVHGNLEHEQALSTQISKMTSVTIPEKSDTVIV